MKTGDIHTLKHTVAENETAEILGSGGLPVYSTPSMICLMELVSYKLAEEHGFQTVGTKVNVSHLKACRPGTELIATAEVVETEGRRIEYAVKVEDAEGSLIGEGTHQRYVIDPERFMSKLA
jgi:predicted thioesterase